MTPGEEGSLLHNLEARKNGSCKDTIIQAFNKRTQLEAMNRGQSSGCESRYIIQEAGRFAFIPKIVAESFCSRFPIQMII